MFNFPNTKFGKYKYLPLKLHQIKYIKDSNSLSDNYFKFCDNEDSNCAN